MVQRKFSQTAAAPASTVFTRDQLEEILGQNIDHIIPEEQTVMSRIRSIFGASSNQGDFARSYPENALGGEDLGDPLLVRDTYGGSHETNRVDVGILGMVGISRASGGHRGTAGPVSFISFNVDKLGKDEYDVRADFAGLGLERAEGVSSRENTETALRATADIIQTIQNGGTYDYDALQQNLSQNGYRPHRYEGDHYRERMAEVSARLKTKEAATSSAPATPEV